MNEELNQKIHKWRGLCWHENVRRVWIESIPFDPLKCPKCDIVVDLNENGDYNPDYTHDPAAMLDLIEAVRDRDEGDTQFTIKQGKRDYWVEIHRLTEGVGEGYADTLPMAVALAVEKLIDSEGK